MRQGLWADNFVGYIHSIPFQKVYKYKKWNNKKKYRSRAKEEMWTFKVG